MITIESQGWKGKLENISRITLSLGTVSFLSACLANQRPVTATPTPTIPRSPIDVGKSLERFCKSGGETADIVLFPKPGDRLFIDNIVELQYLPTLDPNYSDFIYRSLNAGVRVDLLPDGLNHVLGAPGDIRFVFKNNFFSGQSDQLHISKNCAKPE